MLLCLIDSVARTPLSLLLFYTVAEMFYFNCRSLQYGCVYSKSLCLLVWVKVNLMEMAQNQRD